MGALERISETRLELMEDCVILFFGLGAGPEVDCLGTPKFNATG